MSIFFCEICGGGYESPEQIDVHSRDYSSFSALKSSTLTDADKSFIHRATSALGAIAPAIALQFPGTCITPPATVTRFTGIDTRNARMEARYSLPDIIQACHEGYVSQGTLSIDDCIRRYRLLTDSPPLNATADCVAGSVNVEGERTTLPAHTDCATGGFRAIAAFKTLSPSYGGQVERND